MKSSEIPKEEKPAAARRVYAKSAGTEILCPAFPATAI
jgi:hypothetical protein